MATIVLNNSNNTFSTNWWKRSFLKGTESLTKTRVFENCLNSNDVEELQQEVFNTLKTVLKLQSDEHGFRVWKEGKQLSNDEKQAIYNHHPVQNETIQSWSTRVFENQKFGVILNSGEFLNAKLAQKVALKLQPFLKENGMPLLGYNITLFIGNYGFTPLGIHKDPPGESVIHFHLGPGEKTIYQWDNEELKTVIAKEKLSLKANIKELLPIAKAYSFKKGDLYFMPSKNYHIGETNELSIGIALWSNKNFKEELSKSIFRKVGRDTISNNETLTKTTINTLQNVRGISEIFNIQKNQEKLNFKEICFAAYKDLRYSLYSNLGFPKPPMTTIKDTSTFCEEDLIVLQDPFRILYYTSENKDQLFVFIRGQKVDFENNESLTKVLDLINTGDVLHVKEILMMYEEELREQELFSLLHTLELYHGIKKLSFNVI